MMRCLLSLLIVLAAADSIAAMGPPTPPLSLRAEYFDFEVDRATFDRMTAHVELNDAQRDALDRSFAAYRDDLDALADDLDRTISQDDLAEMHRLIGELKPLERVARPTMDQVMELSQKAKALRRDPRWKDVARIRASLIAQVNETRALADARLERWTREFATTVGDATVCDAPGVLWHARRATLRRSGSGDFVRIVRLMPLLVDASARGGELEGLFVVQALSSTLPIRPRPDDPPSELVETINATMASYLRDVDQRSLTALAERRRPPDPETEYQRIFVPEDPEFHDSAKKRAKAWHERLQLSQRAATAIRDVLTAYDMESAANDWWSRFLADICPEVCKPRWCHGMLAWSESLEDLTPEQRDAIEQLQVEYLETWWTKRNAAVEAGIELNREYLVPAELHNTYSVPDPRREAYVAACKQIHVTSIATIRRLADALTDSQQARLTSTLARPSIDETVALLGPPTPGARALAAEMSASEFTEPSNLGAQ